MLNDKKIVVVLPAYNAAATLRKTISEIPRNVVDEIILVDDASKDHTVEVAMGLGIEHVIVHDQNKGYGGNQKTCYLKAIQIKADVVVMLHPDYQYTPKLITAMCSMITSGVYPVVLGSRILSKGALKGGMPLYKYIFNRFLTLFQNILLGQKLSEYHTGYRAYSVDVLKDINFNQNRDGFIFDNEMIAQIFMRGYEIGEVTCPTYYARDSSSISFKNSVRYGWGVLRVSLQYRLNKWSLIRSDLFRPVADPEREIIMAAG